MDLNDDNLDRPEPDDEMSLVFPFVVCESNGGPYADDPFVAGYQAGQIDRALAAMAAVGGSRAKFTVRSALVPQLELIAMHHGFPVVVAEPWGEGPEWSWVTITNDAGEE